MEPELDTLIGILEEQRSLQAALADLSERKTNAIAAGDTGALNAVIAEEKAALGKIRAVEKRQTECVRRLAVILGVPEGSVRMSLMLEKAQGAQRKRLSHLRSELTILIEKQQKLNDVNMKLLQMNLDYVQFLMNASSVGSAGATYGQKGGMRKAPAAAKRLLDRKV